MNSDLKIVDLKVKFQKVSLIPPTKSSYLLLVAEIDRTRIRFFPTESPEKKQMIEKGKNWCKKLRKEDEINSAVVFKALFIPPGRGKFAKEQKSRTHIAKFDYVILIEAASQGKIETIKNSAELKEIQKRLKNSSAFTYLIEAKNVKQIAPVNHKKQGVFLFNYFFADRVAQNLAVWEYTAGWFQQETRLDNSTVLLPTERQTSKYTIINHCRWDNLRQILFPLIFKKSFRSYVLRNFYVNHVAAMPILYKMA